MKHALAFAAAAAALAFAMPQAHSKSLAIYFSEPEQSNAGPRGVDAVSGASALWRDGQVKDSNQYVAELAARDAGADLFRLETVEQYPREHEALTKFAKGEAERNARPELKALPDLPAYDTVFVGYPSGGTACPWRFTPCSTSSLLWKADSSVHRPWRQPLRRHRR